MCYENFIFIYSSAKQHKHLILCWGEHFLFTNIHGFKTGIAYTEAVLSDILGIDSGNAVSNFDTKIIWWKIKPTKTKNALTGSDVEIVPGL